MFSFILLRRFLQTAPVGVLLLNYIFTAMLQADPDSHLDSTSAYPFQNPDLPVEVRIDDLIGRMTLEEKVAALSREASVPRLGLNGSRHIEGYHGVAQGGPSNWGKRMKTATTTQFPQAYGLGATWDTELVRRVADQEATEARYLMQNERYLCSGIIVRAPNADIARDPRWGRTEEVFSEDPCLVAKMSVAFTRGLQGNDPNYWKCASLLKHFLANSNEDDRSKSSSDFDERLLREYYARGFEAAITEGGANAIMAAYNAVNGTPMHIHPMLREILMEEWGLDGIICTDGGGLRLLHTEHKAFPTMAECSAAIIKAGINNFLDFHFDAVNEALDSGLVSELEIDEVLRGLFRVDIKLGLWDPADRVPFAQIGEAGSPEPWLAEETHEFVREVTRKSIVLLKNEGCLLPLDTEKFDSVAIVGPWVNTVLPDWYSGTPPYSVSPRDGIEKYAQPSFWDPVKVGTAWVADMGEVAVKTAADADVAIVVVGNHPEGNASWAKVSSPSEGKEAIDRQDIVLPAEQEEFIRKIQSVNPNTVVVLISNFPFAMPWVVDNVPAILHMTHSSQELGNALSDVLFGLSNPGGKLVQTWPESVDQLPPMMDYDIRHGSTYMYFREDPQFAFGYGLSYTTFQISNLSADSEELSGEGTVNVCITVENTGDRTGDEVVQLYVSFLDSSIDRPARQLMNFSRVTLEPGEVKKVILPLSARDLAFWDVEQNCWSVESGEVLVRVGNSSRDADLKQSLTLRVSE